jgi:AbiV family abortive infection protein
MKGRRVYRVLAEAAVENARSLMRDSRALQRRGSRGHAVSLNVLAIEEGSKALVYKLAAEGVFRIVRRNPNNISTYRERDLHDHPFKHGIATRFLIAAVSFAPFHQALGATRKKVFTRVEVEAILRRAHSIQAIHIAELQRGGQMARKIVRYSQTFGRLNTLKNSGLYVGHPNGSLVEAHVLGRTRGREHRSALQRLRHQLAIVSVRRGDGEPDGDSRSLGL